MVCNSVEIAKLGRATGNKRHRSLPVIHAKKHFVVPFVSAGLVWLRSGEPLHSELGVPFLENEPAVALDETLFHSLSTKKNPHISGLTGLGMTLYEQNILVLYRLLLPIGFTIVQSLALRHHTGINV